MKERGSSAPQLSFQEKLQFLNSLCEKSNKKTYLFQKIHPSRQEGFHAGIGIPGIRLGYVAKKDKTWVELNINIKGDKEKTEKIYGKLLAKSKDIDNKYPELKIEWKPDKRLEKSRVVLSCSDPNKGRIGDTDKWNDIQDDLVERMIKFEQIFNKDNII